MRRRTLERVIGEALERPTTEIIYAVEVTGYPPIRTLFDKQQNQIATQHAEIAQLRMLLKESLGQLERIYLTTKSSSVEYRRLVARTDTVLTRSTLVREEV